MPERPTLYVCHGDEGGPRIHPCRRVQEAMQEVRGETGDTKLPALKLADGTVLIHSRAILSWVKHRPA